MPSPTPRFAPARLQRAMMFTLAVGAATLQAGTALASPVAFSSSTYTTLAQASFGSVTNGPAFATTADTPLPLTSIASVPDPGTATATATAESGHLAATSSAAAAGPGAQGVGVATFLGDFVAPGGPLSLRLDFGSLSDAGGAGAATVIVTLFIDGVPVHEDTLLAAGMFTTAFDAAAGSLGSLELTLSSETIAAGASGQNSADLRFAISEGNVAVPASAGLPSFALLLLAAGGLASARRRGMRASG